MFVVPAEGIVILSQVTEICFTYMYLLIYLREMNVNICVSNDELLVEDCELYMVPLS